MCFIAYVVYFLRSDFDQMSGYLSFEISCLDLDVYEFVMEMKIINQHVSN